MNARFGGSAAAKAKLQRERLLYVGGGALTFSLVFIGILAFYTKNSVEAVPQPSSGQNQISDSVFGTVVLIAPGAPVPKGAKLDLVPLRQMHWPRNEVPEGALRDFSSVNGMYAKVGLPANQPILRANLSSSPPVNVIAELIPPHHRAVSIEVSATGSVEGWATPGAHVDLLVTYFDKATSNNKTRVAVEDAVVLSYDGQIQKSGDSGDSRPRSVSTITLAVTAEDSLKVQTAKAMGDISLVLRNTEDPTSIGKESFGADEWDKARSKTDDNKFSTGFATITDAHGEKKEFELGPDHRWWAVDSPDS